MKYAFVNGKLLNGHQDMKVESNRVILVEDQKIVAIQNDADRIDPDFQIVNLNGQYIMPGLINMHVHLAGNGGSGKPQKKQRDNTKLVNQIFATAIGRKIAHALVAKYARIELMSGVTTIRTVGGLRDLDTTVRDEIADGKRIGPRILAANEGISVPGGHMAGSVAIAAETVSEACRQIDHAKQVKADLVKLMITGGVLDAKEKGTPGELKMKPEMVRQVCDYAHQNGFYVAAHVESPEGVKVALENGVDSIEHGAKTDADTINLYKQHNAFLTCTLSPALPFAEFPPEITGIDETGIYNGKIVFDGCLNAAKECLKNNIPVALGNDVGCPWVTQYDFFRELVYFHKYAGVSNAFALYTATLQNATLAGIGHLTGSIDVGKHADLIVTKENPLDNLCTLRNVTMVMVDGRLIKNPKVKRKAVIDRQLDQYL